MADYSTALELLECTRATEMDGSAGPAPPPAAHLHPDTTRLLLARSAVYEQLEQYGQALEDLRRVAAVQQPTVDTQVCFLRGGWRRWRCGGQVHRPRRCLRMLHWGCTVGGSARSPAQHGTALLHPHAMTCAGGAGHSACGAEPAGGAAGAGAAARPGWRGSLAAALCAAEVAAGTGFCAQGHSPLRGGGV